VSLCREEGTVPAVLGVTMVIREFRLAATSFVFTAFTLLVAHVLLK